MEPTTLAAIALTALITKTIDSLGDGAITSAKQLWKVLKRRPSNTVKQLEAAAQGSNSSDPSIIDVEIIEEEIRAAAEQDPDVQAAVQATAAAMQQQFGGVVNKGKLAEKIGLLIQGGSNTFNIDKLEL